MSGAILSSSQLASGYFLAMTAASANELPSVFFEHRDDVANLHTPRVTFCCEHSTLGRVSILFD
jgi:hypothetical protein